MSTTTVIVTETSTRGGSSQGNFRGRGRGRGGGWRGRGRGGPSGGGQRPQGETTQQPGSTRTQNAPKPRLTHFLALPIGHHAALRERMSAFTGALLQSNPAIAGLDASIVIPARRLHLTLGVMSLATSSHPSSSTEPGHTLAEAQNLLTALRPRILALLREDGGDGRLRVALRRVDIMPPERGDVERAHVMWAGPPVGHGEAGDVESKRLERVCRFVHREFTRAGLIVDDKRPLKLHCTVLNTVYRKPRPKERTPFSYASVLSSTAFRSIQQAGAIADTVAQAAVTRQAGAGQAQDARQQRPQRKPVAIDLGEWSVDEIQICEMGSWGPEGEYVRAGGISLT